MTSFGLLLPIRDFLISALIVSPPEKEEHSDFFDLLGNEMSFPFSGLSRVDIFRFFRPPLDFFVRFSFRVFSIGVMCPVQSTTRENKGGSRRAISKWCTGPAIANNIAMVSRIRSPDACFVNPLISGRLTLVSSCPRRVSSCSSRPHRVLVVVQFD